MKDGDILADPKHESFRREAVSTDYFVRPPVHIFIYNNRALHEHLIIQGALHRVNICPRYIFKTQKWI